MRCPISERGEPVALAERTSDTAGICNAPPNQPFAPPVPLRDPGRTTPAFDGHGEDNRVFEGLSELPGQTPGSISPGGRSVHLGRPRWSHGRLAGDGSDSQMIDRGDEVLRCGVSPCRGTVRRTRLVPAGSCHGAGPGHGTPSHRRHRGACSCSISIRTTCSTRRSRAVTALAMTVEALNLRPRPASAAPGRSARHACVRRTTTTTRSARQL